MDELSKFKPITTRRQNYTERKADYFNLSFNLQTLKTYLAFLLKSATKLMLETLFLQYCQKTAKVAILGNTSRKQSSYVTIRTC